MVTEGTLLRVAPAIYLGATVPQHPLAEAGAWTVRYPDAVVGLLTAAIHHDLTDAFARGTWLCVARGQTVPRSRTAHLHIVQVAPAWLDPRHDAELGIEPLDVHGAHVRLTNPNRTVLDLWRFPHRIPREYALVALKRRVHTPGFNAAELARLARRLGVWNRLQPTLEGMLL